MIDIRKFFDLPEKGLTELDKVVIVRNGEIELGIRADAVLGVGAVTVTRTDDGKTFLGGFEVVAAP